MKFRELLTGELPRTPLLKLSEKGCEQRSEHGFGRYKEGEGAEESVLGGPQSCAIDASEAFRTVSEGAFSEVRVAPVVCPRHPRSRSLL
jgi:hypothetical protein